MQRENEKKLQGYVMIMSVDESMLHMINGVLVKKHSVDNSQRNAFNDEQVKQIAWIFLDAFFNHVRIKAIDD